MNSPEIDDLLARSFEDRRLARGERQGLVAALGPEVDLAALRRRAFELARGAGGGPEALDWLEDVVKALRDEAAAPPPGRAEAHFSPGDDCASTIGRLLRNARRSAEVCVFTITDDRLADDVIDAHRRGASVRVVTDDLKSGDLGSDVERMENAGVPLRVDRSPFHMHHKFMIVDGGTLLTGSYNWTRGAARDNQENLIVSDDPRLVGRFGEVFERLWAAMA